MQGAGVRPGSAPRPGRVCLVMILLAATRVAQAAFAPARRRSRRPRAGPGRTLREDDGRSGGDGRRAGRRRPCRPMGEGVARRAGARRRVHRAIPRQAARPVARHAQVLREDRRVGPPDPWADASRSRGRDRSVGAFDGDRPARGLIDDRAGVPPRAGARRRWRSTGKGPGSPASRCRPRLLYHEPSDAPRPDRLRGRAADRPTASAAPTATRLARPPPPSRTSAPR